MISEIYESHILESSSYFSSHGLKLVGRLVESSLLKVDHGYVLPGHVEFKGKRAHVASSYRLHTAYLTWRVLQLCWIKKSCHIHGRHQKKIQGGARFPAKKAFLDQICTKYRIWSYQIVSSCGVGPWLYASTWLYSSKINASTKNRVFYRGTAYDVIIFKFQGAFPLPPSSCPWSHRRIMSCAYSTYDTNNDKSSSQIEFIEVKWWPTSEAFDIVYCARSIKRERPVNSHYVLFTAVRTARPELDYFPSNALDWKIRIKFACLHPIKLYMRFGPHFKGKD